MVNFFQIFIPLGSIRDTLRISLFTSNVTIHEWEGMMSFKFITILKHIPLNLYIIIGLLKFEISEIFKAFYGLFPEISRY